MYCPNCGLANEAGTKFCSNCGTVLGGAKPAAADPTAGSSYSQPVAGAYPPAAPYRMAPSIGGNSTAKNIGIGCLVAVLIFLFIGVSCTRACFGRHRRPYIIRRY